MVDCLLGVWCARDVPNKCAISTYDFSDREMGQVSANCLAGHSGREECFAGRGTLDYRANMQIPGGESADFCGSGPDPEFENPNIRIHQNGLRW